MSDEKIPSGNEFQKRGRVSEPPPKPSHPAISHTSHEKLGRVIQPPPPPPPTPKTNTKK